MAKSKFFRIAVEGATTDGREIERDWITQMAATYNRVKYGARIFAEHIRGAVPDGPFRALGDVLALKAEAITDGDLKGKMALYAQIAPTDAMVKLIRSGQKIYSSIEIDHNFAGGKLAYLTGMGITDSPASLGTEVLTFAAQHPDASPFRARKQRPENLFSAGLETSIELESEETADDPAEGFFAKLTAILDKFSGQPKPTPDPAPAKDPTATTPTDFTAAQFNAAVGEIGKAMDTLAKQNQAAIEALATQVNAQQQTVAGELASFRQVLDTTESPSTPRTVATGGNGVILTDC